MLKLNAKDILFLMDVMEFRNTKGNMYEINKIVEKKERKILQKIYDYYLSEEQKDIVQFFSPSYELYRYNELLIYDAFRGNREEVEGGVILKGGYANFSVDIVTHEVDVDDFRYTDIGTKFGSDETDEHDSFSL